MVRYLVFLFVIGATSLADAQDKRPSVMYIGSKAGLNLSSATLFHTLNGYKMLKGNLIGINAGVAFQHFYQHHVGFQAEINFSQKGYKQKFDNGSAFETRLNYLEIPMLAVIRTGKNKFHIFANAGVYLEFLLNSKISERPSDADIGSWDFYAYDESSDRKFGYGFRVGSGLSYDFGFGTILADVHFSYSLSNFFNPIDLTTGIPDQSNNFVLGGFVSYMVRFGDL